MRRGSRILLNVFTGISLALCAGTLVLLAAQPITLRDVYTDGHQYKLGASHGRLVVTDIRLVSPRPIEVVNPSMRGFQEPLNIPLWAIILATALLPLQWLFWRIKRRGPADGRGFPVTTESCRSPNRRPTNHSTPST